MILLVHLSGKMLCISTSQMVGDLVSRLKERRWQFIGAEDI